MKYKKLSCIPWTYRHLNDIYIFNTLTSKATLQNSSLFDYLQFFELSSFLNLTCDSSFYNQILT